MSDTVPQTPQKTRASGAPWSDAEKIAYLVVLAENGGKVEAKIASAPIPMGRSITSCKELLIRLKKKYGDDIRKIKAGQALGAASTATVTPGKPKTPGKRKSKVDAEDDFNESPARKKMATPRKKIEEAMRLKMEDDLDEI